MIDLFSGDMPWNCGKTLSFTFQNGWMGAESIQATVYSFALMNFQKSLFHVYEPNSDIDRILMTESTLFSDFTMLLLHSISELGAESKYQKLCMNAHPEYQGRNVCEYNIARAFIDTKLFLEQNISPR